jgi:hypothetical protein
MVPESDDDVRDDDSSSEGGFSISREDCDAMLREFEERLPEMPEEAMPRTVDDVLNIVSSHDHRPSGYRHAGIMEIVLDDPEDDAGQGGSSAE